MSPPVDSDAYTRHDMTVSALRANVMAVVIMLPPIIVCLAVFALACGQRAVPPANYWLVLGGMFALIFAHEAVHGAVWAAFCENGWKSISFGVIWKALTPYCHCKERLTINQLRLGAVAPLIVTGLLPFGLSLIFASKTLLYISLALIFGAGGDALILLMLRKEKRDALAEDHPSLCGCIVYRPK